MPKPEWLKKKEEEEKTGSKTSQSSSVNKVAQNSTFMGGGAAVKKAEERYKGPSEEKLQQVRERASSTSTSTTRRSTPERQTDTGTGRRTLTRAEARDYNNNLKQTQIRRAKADAKEALNTVDNFVRRTAERAGEWEKENLSARNPMLKAQRTVSNQKAGERVAQKFQERFERQEPSKRQKAFTDYTSGVIQRKALGYAKTASDLLKTNEGYQAQGRWAQEDPEFARHIASHEFAQRADSAFKNYSAKQEQIQKRLSAIEKNASGFGKTALQAYGSGLEMGIDRLAGPMWAASMFASAYGNQRGQALKEGATDEQDARAAFFGAGTEVATEYMFKPVAGIASKFGGKHSMDFAGKLAAKVTSRLTGRKAKIADIAIRTLGSQVEEGLEEVAGWLVNPPLQNVAYKNDLQKKRESEAHAEYNDMQQSFWNQFDSREEAQAAALRVNSQEFIDDLTKTYKESGATDEEAKHMASLMQRYFLAHFDNDEEAAKEIESEMDKFVVGDIREKHSWKELGETLASTFLLTGVTGGASVYYTNQVGNQMLESTNGKSKVKQYTDIVLKYDPDNSKDAKTVRNTIDQGGTPTGTQVYQVASHATEVLQDISNREMASNQVKRRRLREEDLRVSPVVQTARGPQFNEETGKAYQAAYDNTMGIIRGVRKHGVAVGLSENTLASSETMRTAAHAVAAYKTGTITAEQINDLTIDNPEVRTVFELATGVDLSQYNVTRNGKIDEVASNNAMMNGLLANAADNYVQMARAEQKQWDNRTRGRVHEAMTRDFGKESKLAMHNVLKTADPRDQRKYMLTAQVAQNVYDYARRTDISWDRLKQSYKSVSDAVNLDSMKDVYDAAKQDKAEAETPYFGRTIQMGTPLRFDKSDNGAAMMVGEFINDSNRELTGEEDEAMRAVADRLGVNIRIVPNADLAITDESGEVEYSVSGDILHYNGSYDANTNTILLAETNGLDDNIRYAMSHETTHLLAQYAPEAYMKLSNYVMDKLFKNSPDAYERIIKQKQALYKKVANQELSEEAALEEVIADATRDFWADPDFVDEVTRDAEPGFIKSIVDAIRDMLRHIRNLLSSGHFDGTPHEDVLWDLVGTYSKAEKLWLDAYRQAARNRAQMGIDELQERANKQNAERLSVAEEQTEATATISEADRTALNEEGIDVTEGGSAFKYSLSSWNDTDQDALLERLVAAGYEEDVAKKWLDDVNSVASIILADMGKLNYIADRYQPALKPNSEYYYTLDLSTLCQKRRLYQGTYNAIMDKIVNYGLKPADTVRLRKMMADMKHEVPCGICYEESRKKNEGKFAETWLNGQTDKEWNQKLKEYNKKLAEYQKKLDEYNALEDKGKKKQPKEPKKPERWLGYANMDHTDPYIPTIADVTTTTGRDRLRQEGHLEALEAYLEYQKGRGSANPKVSFTHTDYRGDILNLTDNDIEKVKHIGGLRIQSFSDFETVHVIDMMQAIMDMATRKLTAQAYTKVPAFADIFGGTGVKINLSLIQKMDENGNPVYETYTDKDGKQKKRLVFDPVEGIDPKEAFRIRGKYSDNVGTILVGVSVQQILDAWADPRVDMVIPFHRSGWSLEEFEKLGLKGYEDFQAFQSEAYWDEKQKKWISLKDAKMEGIYPADYWNDKLSGKENAKAYLKLCAEKHYRPVFYNFLKDNGDGTWSLQEDGSTDGYWKSLIDYKMYNNEGADVSKQSEVQPIFDMDVAEKVMSDYEGNADTLPIAEDVVEAYLKDYKKRYPKAKIDYGDDVRLSISVEMDDAYMDAYFDGDDDAMQDLVDKAAKAAGYKYKAFHHTEFAFTVFDRDRARRSMDIQGFYFSEDPDAEREYGSVRYDVYLKMDNPYIVDSKESWDAFPMDYGTMDAGVTARERLQELGYDSVIRKADYFGAEADEYIVFEPEQIKSSEPMLFEDDPNAEYGEGDVIPLSQRFDPSNPDIRYSLPTQDSDGNILTDGQMEYFKNSQARDAEGKLIPMYHVTPMGGFTIFDPTYSSDQRSISFTNDMDFALNYSSDDEDIDAYRMAYETRLGDGETIGIGHYKTYLDMQNPYIVNGSEIVFNDEVEDLTAYAQGEGYDGLIMRNFQDLGADVYQVFSSNQVKDTRNENPSENPDIRYSIATRDEVSGYLMQNAESITDIPLQDARLEENRVRYSLDATNFENSIVSEWGIRKRNLAEEVQETPLKNKLISLMKQVRKGSGTDRQYNTETIEETIRSIKKMYYFAKGDKAKEFAREAWDAAERIVDDIDYNDELYKQYQGITDYFASYRINLSEDIFDAFGNCKNDDVKKDFEKFIKDNSGKIRFSWDRFSDASDIVELHYAYSKLSKEYPDLFPSSIDNPIDMLLQMDYVLNLTDPYRDAYTSEEHSKLVEDIANNLCDIVDEGNEYKATIDDLNIKAMRQRHKEAILKVKEIEKQKRDNQIRRAELWKTRYNERIKQDQADKEAGKQKQNEKKLVGDIEKNIKWLSDRLRPETRTKDNAIPEQFRSALAGLLAEFDLQSKGSKKIEKKKGYPSKTTIKLKQLREQYAAIAKENDDDGDDDGNNVFRYNGDLLVKMDELIKTMEGLDKFFDKRYGREVTIADLSLSEMFIIDTMLKSLVHQFREYKNVTIDSKRAEIAGVSSEVIGDMDTQINRHGAAREGGALGKVSGLLNMSEVTPIYFFKRLGAMYKMYRELRKGFDKYIENDREVIKRLSKIMSGYYNKKNPGTTIESWRTAEDAQTFNFEHGPITLSVAQMMEVYLYANRPQAFGHMIGDGIIVTPISPVGKIETAKEKLLGHEPMVDPVRLTYENVQEIISKLSEEQVNMANKLQELVAGYMSDLGNETTMKLYGYKMFDDPNYFGIHVSQTATNSSVDAPAITETIKNFGWTKPLTPGAKNTIVIGDIFTDVARYCNEMNQFNAYAVPVSDFMRVYNYMLRDEDGTLKGSAKSAIIKAFGKQAHTYIMNFLRDLNGASMRRNGGLEGLIDSALGRAKKAAVFMNMRVALQQPTAIVRAFAQINFKYFIGVRPSRKATQEMIEHCPIAQWKAWGFYDTHFGRNVEDLIMNNWSKADIVGSALYGALDNMTWGMIWQAVKKEVEAKQPALDKGSPAYWEACKRRASEVFDSTQVVDSPFHRSDAMRSKDTLVKQFTSFQSEPTLSFNVVRDFVVQAYDAVSDGDKSKAAKLIAKGFEIWTLQAAVVAAAQSLWDAVRHKDPDGDDDEDEGFLELWWQNFMADFVDDLKLYNNVYFLKEFTPYAEKLVDYMKTGKWNTYDSNKLLMFQGAEKMTQGLQQFIKKLQKGDEYKHKNGEPYTWYEVMTNFLGGIGYITGMPIGTVMRDAQSILKWFHINAFAEDGTKKTRPGLVDAVAQKMGYKPIGSGAAVVSEKTSEKKAEPANYDAELEDYEESLPDTYTDDQKKKLVKQYEKTLEAESTAESEGSTLEGDALRESIKQSLANFEYEMEKRSLKAAENAAGLSGNARNNALWDVIAEGYTNSVDSGNMGVIWAMREKFEENGGDVEWFDAKITDKMKSSYKKTIGVSESETPGITRRQEVMRNYMTQHGVSDEELSEIVRKTYTASDLKAAMRMGNEEYMIDELVPLIQAGLTRADYEYLYKYRNYGAKYYDGKYSDPKYKASTGTYVWPTQGSITSLFGYRSAASTNGVGSTNHPAIDIGAPAGTEVVAADGGVVISAGWAGGYGNQVAIKHDDGTITYYSHLSGWNVKEGDKVSQGQQIAQVGSTGNSTGAHLDFKVEKDGEPVDPLQFLDTTNATYALDA